MPIFYDFVNLSSIPFENLPDSSVEVTEPADLDTEQLIEMLKTRMNNSGNSDSLKFQLQQSFGLSNAISKPPLPGAQSNHVQNDESQSKSVDSELIQKKTDGFRPTTAPVMRNRSNTPRNSKKPNPTSKINSLPGKQLKNKAQMAMLEQQLDPNDPEYIRKKSYMDWLSKKSRITKREKTGSSEKAHEQEKLEEEKQAEARAENMLARKAWLKRKKPALKQKKSDIESENRKNEEDAAEKLAEVNLNKKHCEKYRQRRAKEVDLLKKKRAKKEQEEKRKVDEEKEKRMHDSKVASLRWRESREKSFVKEKREKRKEERRGSILSDSLKRTKGEVGKDAHLKWCEGKEKQERTEKIMRKFKVDLKELDDLEDDKPWK